MNKVFKAVWIVLAGFCIIIAAKEFINGGKQGIMFIGLALLAVIMYLIRNRTNNATNTK